MREENKAKKALVLTAADFKSATDANVIAFTNMLRDDLYAFRVKKALYEKGKISPRGFAFNDDIFNLPLGKKDAKGMIYTDAALTPLFERFVMSTDYATNGDALTAFLIDHNDEFYNEILQAKLTGVDLKDKYIELFNLAYKQTSNVILTGMIGDFISTDEKLQDILEEETALAEAENKANEDE